MKRAQDDELELVPDQDYGRAESNVGPDDDAGPFPGWLYVPDLSSTTGWTSVQLRKPTPKPRERSHIGFRR